MFQKVTGNYISIIITRPDPYHFQALSLKVDKNPKKPQKKKKTQRGLGVFGVFVDLCRSTPIYFRSKVDLDILGLWFLKGFSAAKKKKKKLFKKHRP